VWLGRLERTTFPISTSIRCVAASPSRPRTPAKGADLTFWPTTFGLLIHLDPFVEGGIIGGSSRMF